MACIGPASAAIAMSGPVAVVVVMVLCLLLGGGGVIQARRLATYIVGDEYGWDLINAMYTWPKDKTFYAGDILVKEYNSSHDRIQIAYGSNYFIRTYNPDDCPAGLKMAIEALAPPPSSS